MRPQPKIGFGAKQSRSQGSVKSGSPDFCRVGGSLTGSLKTHPVVGGTPEASRSQSRNGFSEFLHEGWVITPSLGFLRGLLFFLGPLSLWLKGEGRAWLE